MPHHISKIYQKERKKKKMTLNKIENIEEIECACKEEGVAMGSFNVEFQLVSNVSFNHDTGDPRDSSDEKEPPTFLPK